MLGASDNGRKINIWSTNKFLNELHTAVSVVFSILFTAQSKMVKNSDQWKEEEL